MGLIITILEAYGTYFLLPGCPIQPWYAGVMPRLIASCYTKLGWYHWEPCFSLKRDWVAKDMVEKGGWTGTLRRREWGWGQSASYERRINKLANKWIDK